MANEGQESSPSDRELRANERPKFEAAYAAPSSAPASGGAAAVSDNEYLDSSATESGDSAETFSPIAAALGADQIGFLRALYAGVGSNMPFVARRDLLPKGRSGEDEAAFFELIATAAVEESEETIAATICAALAARTVAQAIRRHGDDLSPADGEALLSAWIDTARSLAAARGAFAMRRLLSTARLLAERAVERRASVTEIVAIVRRLAMKIAADFSLDRAFGGPIETPAPDRMSRAAWARRAVAGGRADMTLHAR